MQTISKFKIYIIGTCVVLSLFGVFFTLYKPTKVQNVLNYVRETVDLISTSTISISKLVGKTVFTPGGIVSKIESVNTNLSHAGVLLYTNIERKNNGVSTLSQNVFLDTVAQRRAKDMFAKQYFEHISPTGGSASLEADDLGYEYITIGENIALGNFGDDKGLVDAWMASPGHRANIVNTKFTEIGIATIKGVYEGRDTWIGVQIFARPLALCTKVDENQKLGSQIKIRQLESLHAESTKIQNTLKATQQPVTQSEVDAFNTLVDEYNIIADKINALNAEVKVRIDSYNAQVRNFNTCIK